MAVFFKKLGLVFTDGKLLRRLGFVFLALLAFRVLASIPIPGVDAVQLEQFFSSNQLFGFLNIFSGGGLSALSIVMLGVGPYITASIILQVLTIVFPALKSMYQEEGEIGRKKFNQYGRLLTVPLAFIQGFSFLFLLESQGVVTSLSVFDFAMNLIVIVSGSLLLMWIGELITEFGIGNGISLIIFAGIISSLPSVVAQLVLSFDPSQIPLYVSFAVAALLVIYGVVLMTEAERPVPVTYANRSRGGSSQNSVATYLPLRLNQAGVIPIIFALSILLFPGLILNFIAQANIAVVSGVAQTLLTIHGGAIIYGIFYFLLVFAFTFFYTAVTFDPNQMANNLQKGGAFVPGVRPGGQTSEYLGRIITRITFVGAIFLGSVAVLPLIMQSLTGITTLAIGGTALLIAVSVILDLVRKIDAQISLREY
ncbi:preprotein translocase subunit SecY [Candidatus Kaiserbacteria bacterium CG10_big_fil_rev_8_21_14_0_10_45_20]|uniref:Protein translocase subunit SecY n=1 Tax=Candidatus Kaiserbacteria bacterium CG10_big_fil_rev_8_21_14_0_10_45_20 TaxID=1974607 RepID=A0A2H0UFK2_9BACT|nr:MAG: preprotein translocase subunit SecY [Candidatus Kaiserbacteria bacterium CG10_big_fil_rev_8_21_14_0_10_45_20]